MEKNCKIQLWDEKQNKVLFLDHPVFVGVKERLAVSFVELGRGGSSRGHFRVFFVCLNNNTFVHYDIEKPKEGTLEL